MLARIEHRLTFLTGGAVDLPARQRTMRETIAWSYDLLTSQEQELFRSMAIFDGGCSLPAIEELCATNDAPGKPLDSVETLQRNSLLRQEETVADLEPRFRMLETIREYALERLAASGTEEELRQRHVDYYLSFAEEVARGLYGPATASLLDRVESDHANLRAAVRWCPERKDADRGLRLAAVLWSFWFLLGSNDGEHLLEP